MSFPAKSNTKNSSKTKRETSGITLSTISDKGFETIYRKYYRKLFGVAFGILKQQEKAEGIIHDVFLSVWERRDQINIDTSLEGYLMTSVKLSVLAHIRQSKTRKRHLTTISKNSATSENIVEMDYGAQELQERIDGLVGLLPDKCRKVYKLSREQGKNNKEISFSLNIAEKTVEAHISKALSFLKSRLKEYTFFFFL
ncbi:MAG: RNA polymerase sigma-70 factor [Bacteroidota bacterium]